MEDMNNKPYWRRRVFDTFSKFYFQPSKLNAHSDKYFEDFCIMPHGRYPWVTLRTIGIRHSHPEFAMKDWISERYYLFCVLSGKGYANGQVVTGPDDGDNNVILFKRNNLFNLSADPKDPFVYCWLSFGGEKGDNYVSLLNMETTYSIYRMGDLAEKIYTVFYDMLYVDHEDREPTLYLESRLTDLLSMLKKAEKVPVEHLISDAENPHVNQASEYILNNCFKPDFSVGDVAEHLGLNEKYLRSLFAKETQMSMRDFVTDLRMKRAKDLLKHSNYNVSEIADFTGYRDYRQFHSIFKEKTGLSPSEYRTRNG